MRQDEQVKYLANVFTIAAADGTVASEESRMLKEIIRKIGANADAVEQARQLVIRGSYKMQALQGRQDRETNIEDMVMVALADGELSAEETGPIEKLSDILKMSQQQMDTIVTRAQRRLKSEGHQKQGQNYAGKAIPRRAKPNPPALPHAPKPPPPPPKAKAAPKPPPTPPTQPRPPRKGAVKQTFRRAEKPKKKQAFQPVAKGVVLHFSGLTCERAEELISEMGSVEERGDYREDGRLWHYGVWSRDHIADAARFSLKVYALGSRKIHVDGEEIVWDEIFGFCPCAISRMTSDAPAVYCFGAGDEHINIWGCKQAAMAWSDQADWCVLGRFTGNDTFAFDKTRICRKLEENLKRFCYCPYINEQFMQAALARLPKHVKAICKWKLREADAANQTAEVKTIRENVHGCVMTYDAPVDGIVPTDWREGVRLIRQAANDCDRDDLDFKALKDLVPMGEY